MHPELLKFSLGVFAIDLQAYAFFLTLAAVVTVTGGWIVATKRGLPRRGVALILVATAIAGFFGARLLHAATHVSAYRNEPWRLFALDFNGLALFGGFAAAAVVGWAGCRFARLDAWRLADSVAAPLGIGISIARIGCFLNGCCFGQTTSLPWGMQFPLFSKVHLYQLSQTNGANLLSVAPVHPTQIYDAVAALSGAKLAAWCLHRRFPPGVAFASFIGWYALCRLILQLFRIVMPSEDAPPCAYPVLFLTVALVSAFVVWKKCLTSRISRN